MMLQQLIVEMEKRLQDAKSAQKKEDKLASITAIQALCNVALDAPEKTEPQTTFLQQTQPVVPVQNAMIRPQVMEEEDANGESIFDF